MMKVGQPAQLTLGTGINNAVTKNSAAIGADQVAVAVLLNDVGRISAAVGAKVSHSQVRDDRLAVLALLVSHGI